MTIADVNGDGKPDVLVTGCAYDPNVSGGCAASIDVLFNNGDGTFTAGPAYTTHSWRGTSIAVADVNGDGKPDAVVTNQQVSGTVGANSTVTILLGNGDGTFQAPKMSSVTTLTSSLNPSIVTQTVNFNVRVTPSITGGDNPTGTVTFKQGSTTLATVPLSGGQAGYATTYATMGTRLITAIYSGDSNLVNSSSATIKQVVTKDPTTATLTSSENPSLFGDNVTLTATITVSNNTLPLPPPNGTVTVKDGTATLGTVSVSSGSASLIISSLTAGTHSITARYSGDSDYLGSASPKLSQVVHGLPTTTGLSVDVNPSSFGQTLTFTATVAPNSGTATPTGAVTFKLGTMMLGKVSLSGGMASYQTSALTAGTKGITAVYSGNATYATSTSAVLSQVVGKAATTTALVSSTNPFTAGQSVTLTATVSPQFSGTPTGSVSFKLGTKLLKAVTLSGGSASYSTTTLPAGADNITATYNGSADFSSSSASMTQNVN